MCNTESDTEARGRSREVKAPNGRRIGVPTPTSRDDEGTYELIVTPEIGRSLRSYVASTLEATPGGDPSRVWRAPGAPPRRPFAADTPRDASPWRSRGRVRAPVHD